MGIAGSPDIFQAKMSELMMVLEYVNTYLDDLLIIPKKTLKDHLTPAFCEYHPVFLIRVFWMSF